MSDDAIKLREAVNDAFRARRHETATEQELRDWLAVLCTETAGNERLHPRDIIRGLTINHTQMARTISTLETTIAQLNRENDRVARRVLWLTFICAGGTLAQVIIALCR